MKEFTMVKIFNNNFYMLSIFVIISALICVVCRYEVLSDLQNYHYYVVWAFMRGRTFSDIAVGIENSYHNPLVEMPIYYLINTFNENILVYQLYNSIYWGLLLFVFYLFIKAYFNVNTTKGIIQTTITLLLVMTGFAFLTQNGTSSHEVSVILGIMSGLYLVYKELFILKTERLKIFFISGMLMGLAMGLKLTAVIYCIASGLTLMMFYKILKTPFKTISVFTFGGIIGFLIAFGWWGIILYRETGNPIFPYMNTIFQSPYYPDTFLTYNTYYEKNWWNWIIFPFLSSFQGNDRISSETYMIDMRLAFGYVLLIGYLAYALYSHRLIADIKNNKNTAFLVIFAIIGYVLWFYLFSIIRYAIPIEMIISLMLVYFVSNINPQNITMQRAKHILSIIGVICLLYGLPYTSWGNTKALDKMVDVEKVVLPENALLIAMSSGTGLVATKIIDDNKDIKIINEAADFIIKDSKYKEKIEEYKKNSPYKAYLIVLRSEIDEFDYQTPIQYISNLNTNMAFSRVFSNLQYMIKHRLGVKNFYCRSIGYKNVYNKVFMCIDKKDRDKVFPEAPKSMRRRFFRKNNTSKIPLVFKKNKT